MRLFAIIKTSVKKKSKKNKIIYLKKLKIHTEFHIKLEKTIP